MDKKFDFKNRTYNRYMNLWNVSHDPGQLPIFIHVFFL